MKHDVVDKGRKDIEKYLQDNEITFLEWEFIQRYINEKFDSEKDRIILKTISN